MEKIFENYVEHSFGAKEQAIFKFKQFEFNYRKYFPKDLSTAVLLDVGIGRGEMLSCMKNWGGQNFLGVDISPSTIQFCRSLNLPCELVPDSTKYLNDNPSTFDVITLLDVLEHIPKHSIIDFLMALHKALKPGGVLIIQVPNLQAPDGHLHRYNDITHEVGFIEQSLAQVLMASGFRKFTFIGFEEYVFGSLGERARKFFRWVHWLSVRFLRKVDGNLNPKVLNPVFAAVVQKGD
jgi:2-polyprenyl-3-methyl-5-hydroxy-6-metoxy-1,4-benzoquinol methylase